MNTCPCGTGLAYQECCGPIIDGTLSASSAEQEGGVRSTHFNLTDRLGARGLKAYLYSLPKPIFRLFFFRDGMS